MNIRLILSGLVACVALCAVPGTTCAAQIFVANFDIFAPPNTGTIGEYNATTGATVNASLISGLNEPGGIAVSGGNLFVADFGFGIIGEYNATTGATETFALVSGLNGPAFIAVTTPSSVADASSTWILLLLALTATFGLKVMLRQPA
jgi:hypothetical protein